MGQNSRKTFWPSVLILKGILFKNKIVYRIINFVFIFVPTTIQIILVCVI